MKTIDYGDDRAGFLRALGGKPSKPKARARDSRPGMPRVPKAERGDGERLDDLYKLAAAGYTLLHSTPGACYLVNVTTAQRTPERATYRQALDAALAHIAGDTQ